MADKRNVVIPLYDFTSPRSFYHCDRDTDLRQLISLVKQHPELYDTDHDDYMRSKLKEEVWRAIGKTMDLRSNVVKNKWMNLRDRHHQALRLEKKNRKNHIEGTLEPWLYQKEMEFLLPFMKQKIYYNLQESEDEECDSGEFLFCPPIYRIRQISTVPNIKRDSDHEFPQ